MSRGRRWLSQALLLRRLATLRAGCRAATPRRQGGKREAVRQQSSGTARSLMPLHHNGREVAIPLYAERGSWGKENEWATAGHTQPAAAFRRCSLCLPRRAER
ncbi:unnamed protein product [Phaeothamnion confervicola]